METNKCDECKKTYNIDFSVPTSLTADMFGDLKRFQFAELCVPCFEDIRVNREDSLKDQFELMCLELRLKDDKCGANAFMWYKIGHRKGVFDVQRTMGLHEELGNK